MHYLEIDVVCQKATLKTVKKTYLSIDLFMSYARPNQIEIFSQFRITDFGQLQK